MAPAVAVVGVPNAKVLVGAVAATVTVCGMPNVNFCPGVSKLMPIRNKSYSKEQ